MLWLAYIDSQIFEFLTFYQMWQVNAQFHLLHMEHCRVLDFHFRSKIALFEILSYKDFLNWTVWIGPGQYWIPSFGVTILERKPINNDNERNKDWQNNFKNKTVQKIIIWLRIFLGIGPIILWHWRAPIVILRHEILTDDL